MGGVTKLPTQRAGVRPRLKCSPTMNSCRGWKISPANKRSETIKYFSDIISHIVWLEFLMVCWDVSADWEHVIFFQQCVHFTEIGKATVTSVIVILAVPRNLPHLSACCFVTCIGWSTAWECGLEEAAISCLPGMQGVAVCRLHLLTSLIESHKVGWLHRRVEDVKDDVEWVLKSCVLLFLLRPSITLVTDLQTPYRTKMYASRGMLFSYLFVKIWSTRKELPRAFAGARPVFKTLTQRFAMLYTFFFVRAMHKLLLHRPTCLASILAYQPVTCPA